MSRLLQFFASKGAFFVFALLEIICFYMIISSNSQQQEVASATWSLYASRYMEKADRLNNYLSLEQKNQQLRDENAGLISIMKNSSLSKEVKENNIQDDSLHQRYAYISAEIINKSPLSANITYVVNKGQIHGVEKHQGVISADGVIGIVTAVSPRHARIMSLLHRDMYVSAGLKKNKFFGSLNWRGGDTRFAYLSKIPDYALVAIGDTIETTGFSNIFPTAISIGEVVEKKPIQGENTLDIKVRLFNDFFNVRNTYIIRDLVKDDLEQLDSDD